MEHGRRVWWHLGTYLMAHLLDASDMDCILDVAVKENLSPVLCIYECIKVLFNDYSESTVWFCKYEGTIL